jgi:hypothetical protein
MDQPVGEGKVPGCRFKLFGVFGHLQYYVFSQDNSKLVVLHKQLVIAFYLLLLCQTPRHIGN